MPLGKYCRLKLCQAQVPAKVENGQGDNEWGSSRPPVSTLQAHTMHIVLLCMNNVIGTEP